MESRLSLGHSCDPIGTGRKRRSPFEGVGFSSGGRRCGSITSVQGIPASQVHPSPPGFGTVRLGVVGVDAPILTFSPDDSPDACPPSGLCARQAVWWHESNDVCDRRRARGAGS